MQRLGKTCRSAGGAFEHGPKKRRKQLSGNGDLKSKRGHIGAVSRRMTRIYAKKKGSCESKLNLRRIFTGVAREPLAIAKSEVFGPCVTPREDLNYLGQRST